MASFSLLIKEKEVANGKPTGLTKAVNTEN